MIIRLSWSLVRLVIQTPRVVLIVARIMLRHWRARSTAPLAVRQADEIIRRAFR